MRRSLVACACALIAATFTTVPSAASAAVSVGQSGWFWGSPQPQGNDLRAIDFAGSRGYAAGEFGTLLRTDDAGATWSGIATGITVDLQRVRLVGSDTVIVGGGCTVRRSDNGGGDFTRLPFSPSDLTCPSPIRSLFFPSSQVGYLVLENGTVVRTDDGGKTFSRRTAVPSTPVTAGTAKPTDIVFTGVDTGFAITKEGGPGRIYRTTDGAVSWTLVASHDVGFNGLYFTDAGNGFAVGDRSSLFATTDGGVTFTQRPLEGSGASADLSSIRCAGISTCLVTTVAGDRLLRTTDGGETATSVTPSTQKVFAAAFASQSRAVAVGQLGTTVVSDDSGVNYAPVGGRVIGQFSRLRATSSQVAYAAGADGTVARTLDGGQSWTGLGVPTPTDVADVAFPSADRGFALDSAGSLQRTDNGGTSWQLLNTGTSARPSAVVAVNARNVLLIGPRGVRRSTDGGDQFTGATARVVSRANLTDADVVGGAVFVSGSRSIVFSPNGGGRWTAVKPPNRRTIRRVDFVTSRVGFLLDGDGKFWLTRNRGEDWTQRVSTGTLGGYDIAFSDGRQGYMLFPSEDGYFPGDVLRTTDGGRTWRPQLITKDRLIRGGIATAGGQTAFAAASNGFLYGTSSGGDAGGESELTLTTERRSLRRAARIKVSGRLKPADGGEQVVVSMREQGQRRFDHQTVQVASNGTFTTTWRVRRRTVFIAQWRGDDDSRGDGTLPLEVAVGR